MRLSSVVLCVDVVSASCVVYLFWWWCYWYIDFGKFATIVGDFVLFFGTYFFECVPVAFAEVPECRSIFVIDLEEGWVFCFVFLPCFDWNKKIHYDERQDNCADCNCDFGWSFHILNLLVIAMVMVYMISTTSAIEPIDVSSSCHQVCL